MLSQYKLVAFAFSTDYARSRAFYVDKLGLEYISEDGFALVLRSGENTIRLGKAQAGKFTAAPHTVLGWEVPSVDRAAAELRAKGVVFEKYPWVNDPNGIWTAPGGDKVGWFKDPDGNVLSISEHRQS